MLAQVGEDIDGGGGMAGAENVTRAFGDALHLTGSVHADVVIDVDEVVFDEDCVGGAGFNANFTCDASDLTDVFDGFSEIFG